MEREKKKVKSGEEEKQEEKKRKTKGRKEREEQKDEEWGTQQLRLSRPLEPHLPGDPRAPRGLRAAPGDRRFPPLAPRRCRRPAHPPALLPPLCSRRGSVCLCAAVPQPCASPAASSGQSTPCRAAPHRPCNSSPHNPQSCAPAAASAGRVPPC